MKYLLLLTGDGDAPHWASMTEAEQAKLMERFSEFSAACGEREGVEILGGEALLGPDSATTIRRSGGNRTVTEGPYAEAYEGLGGYYLVETPDLDTLLELSDILPPYDMELRPIDAM